MQHHEWTSTVLKENQQIARARKSMVAWDGSEVGHGLKGAMRDGDELSGGVLAKHEQGIGLSKSKGK